MLRYIRLKDAFASIRYRLGCWIYEKIFGEPAHMIGCHELRVYSADDSGYTSFAHCTEIEFEGDNMMWFQYLEHEKGDKFEWPARETNETPLDYIDRLAKLPGVERHVHAFQHYESIILRGYFKYESASRNIMLQFPIRVYLRQDDKMFNGPAERKLSIIEGRQPPQS